MSEFSESYHIRTNDPAATVRRLRDAKLAGLSFGPANGWLTFVPYGELELYRQFAATGGFARYLNRVLSATVMHYFYAEDYGWGFTFAVDGAVDSGFAQWWSPECTIERDGLDLARIQAFAEVNVIAALLENSHSTMAGQEPTAYCFAKLLGLPAYERLSPYLAQRSQEEFLSRDAKKVGTKPKSVTERIELPPDRRLQLPRPDLSAKEALAIVRPFMVRYERLWPLCEIFCGNVTPAGRLSSHVAWTFTYRHRDGVNYLRTSLYSNGNLAFDGVTALMSLRAAIPISGDWMDSTDVVGLVSQNWMQQEIHSPATWSLTLTHQPDLPTLWEIAHRAAPHVERERHTYSKTEWAVNATYGDVLFERFEVMENGRLVKSRRRVRDEGGSWTEV